MLEDPLTLHKSDRLLAPDGLQGCELPAAWANQPAWRVLDTHMAPGRHFGPRFLATWAAWRADPERPRSLHYVAITAAAPDVHSLNPPSQTPNVPAVGAAIAPLARLLADQCFGLLPGFHRLEFERGRVLLTLCIGELKAMLREQQFAADTVFLGRAGADSISGTPSNPAAPLVWPGWDLWTVKALARCCRRGTRIVSGQITQALHQALSQSGFEMGPAAASDAGSGLHCSGIYNPRWEPNASRSHCPMQAQRPGTCVVVGAGLAGASVAQALARRGWQVTVLDSASAPAAGASGVPVGLMAPHVSTDDSPRSRLTRAGIRLMLNQAAALLVRGQDWDATGVLERRMGGSHSLPKSWGPEGLAWSAPADDRWANAPWAGALADPAPALWHAQGGWIKPARLVQAWLAQPGVRFQGDACVASIQRDADHWVLLDAARQVLARATLVVLASAGGSTALLQALNQSTGSNPLAKMPQLHALPGQISWALQRPVDTPHLPPHPVNGQGSLIAHVPMGHLPGDSQAGGLAWFAGATYEMPDRVGQQSTDGQHRTNFDRLAALLPACAKTLSDRFEPGAVQAWRGIRCASSDRLPIVGPLTPFTPGDGVTLWISTALGSRGLSLAVLCAELLASRLCAEPLPLEASLATHLDCNR